MYASPPLRGGGPLVIWSSYLFGAGTNHEGGLYRLFSTGLGQKGQGHAADLTSTQTNIVADMAAMSPLEGVEITEVWWEVSVRPPQSPLEELARAGMADDDPAARPGGLARSPMGVLAYGSWMIETTTSRVNHTPMSYGMPVGILPQTAWYRTGRVFETPIRLAPRAPFSLAVSIGNRWEPEIDTTVRFSLSLREVKPA